MSTAHRPTFNPAIASEIMGGVLRHGASGSMMAKDQKGQTKMKLRVDGQNSEADVKGRDLRAELEDRERKAFEIKAKEKSEYARPPAPVRLYLPLRLTYARFPSSSKPPKKTDGGKQPAAVPAIAGGASYQGLSIAAKGIDADDTDSEEEDSDEDDDDDDETEMLMLELEKIKKERAAEAAAKVSSLALSPAAPGEWRRLARHGAASFCVTSLRQRVFFARAPCFAFS